MVAYMQLREFLHELPGVGVVRLIPGCRSDIHLYVPCCLIGAQNVERAVLLAITAALAPDASFSYVVTSECDDEAKHIGVMWGNVHRSKTAHGETAYAAIRGFSDRTIPGIDIPDQVNRNVCLDILVVVKAIAPFACRSGASIAVRQNQDEIGYLNKSNQRNSGLISLATSEPIAIFAW